MATRDRSRAVLMAQYKKATKEPNEYVKFCLKSDNELNVWYIMLSGFTGDDDEFAGGEYLVRIQLPAEFPFKPPEFYFLTEQGLYGVETKVCISIGEYHADQYRSALGVDGFCNQLVSGLIGWKTMGGGIAIKNTTERQKRKLADESKAYNMAHYPEILAQINSEFENYSAKWDLKKIPEQLRAKLGLPEPAEDKK